MPAVEVVLAEVSPGSGLHADLDGGWRRAIVVATFHSGLLWLVAWCAVVPAAGAALGVIG